MVETHGLTHVALVVRDLDRAVHFYEEVFGVHEYFRSDTQVQVQGPGSFDIIAFDLSDEAKPPGGITHIGFRLRRPEDISLAVSEVQKAGGTVLRKGEFAPGMPFAFVADPDGHEIEIWFE